MDAHGNDAAFDALFTFDRPVIFCVRYQYIGANGEDMPAIRHWRWSTT
jgi:phosphoketolase